MLVSVLINNYNYGRFVGEAVASALRQTVLPAEVIVVDDGSTDHSADVIRGLAQKEAKVRPVFQKNAGQLAAIEAAVSHASGELLFFLDADDFYEPRHVERAVEAFTRHPDLGFYFSDHRQERGPKVNPNLWGNGYLGPSACLTCLSRARIGSIVSPLALRRRIADRLFPFDRDLHGDWRLRADDCLVWGASLAGASKYYHPEETVFYRIHGSNNFTGQREDTYGDYLYDLRKTRLLDSLARKFGVHPEAAGRQIVKEFKLNPSPNRVVYRRYLKAIRAAPVSWPRKVRSFLAVTSHYRHSRRARPDAAQA